MTKLQELFSTPYGEIRPALFIVLFVTALALTWLFTKLVLAYALKKKLFGPVGGRHIGGRQVPRLGGVALVAAFGLTALLAAFLHKGRRSCRGPVGCAPSRGRSPSCRPSQRRSCYASSFNTFARMSVASSISAWVWLAI